MKVKNLSATSYETGKGNGYLYIRKFGYREPEAVYLVGATIKPVGFNGIEIKNASGTTELTVLPLQRNAFLRALRAEAIGMRSGPAVNDAFGENAQHTSQPETMPELSDDLVVIPPILTEIIDDIYHHDKWNAKLGDQGRKFVEGVGHVKGGDFRAWQVQEGELVHKGQPLFNLVIQHKLPLMMRALGLADRVPVFFSSPVTGLLVQEGYPKGAEIIIRPAKGSEVPKTVGEFANLFFIELMAEREGLFWQHFGRGVPSEERLREICSASKGLALQTISIAEYHAQYRSLYTHLGGDVDAHMDNKLRLDL